MKIINTIVAAIKKFNNIAIFTHKNIDGDSYSCSYGLALAIKEKYPQKQVKIFTDYKYLRQNFSFLEAKKSMFGWKVKKQTLGIIGDVCDKNRIQFFNELQKCQEIICYDHHQNKVNFKVSLFWWAPDYPASSLQATEIAFSLKHKFKENTAIALLFGILTDTGFFRYSNNYVKAPYLYSQLLKFTTEKSINQLFIDMSQKDKTDIEIQNYIYANINFQKNVVYVIIKKKYVNKYGYSKIKSKINIISNIKGYDYWAFFIETNEDIYKYKVSLRTAKKIVNKIAEKYSGGGLTKASGCYAKNDQEVQKIILDMINND